MAVVLLGSTTTIYVLAQGKGKITNKGKWQQLYRLVIGTFDQRAVQCIAGTVEVVQPFGHFAVTNKGSVYSIGYLLSIIEYLLSIIECLLSSIEYLLSSIEYRVSHDQLVNSYNTSIEYRMTSWSTHTIQVSQVGLEGMLENTLIGSGYCF